MTDEKPIQELQPNWHHRDAESLEGQVTVYINEIIDGVTYQHRPLVRIAFTRKGKAATSCTGHLELQIPEGGEALVGSVPMIQGNVGNKLRKRGGLLVASGWDTDECDAIFQNAGGLTWSEVFDTLPPPVEEKTTPPEVD